MGKTIHETEKRSPSELVKEAIRRANKKEKQELKSIIDRKIAIRKRIKEIELERERLEQRSRENKMPNKTYYTREEIETMSSEEMQAWNKRIDKETAEFSAWNDEDNSIQSERFRLTMEFIELFGEFYDLERKEKWLLLSIAFRSQPSLMRYV